MRAMPLSATTLVYRQCDSVCLDARQNHGGWVVGGSSVVTKLGYA